MPAKPDLTPIERDKLEIDPNFDFRDIAARPFHDLTTNEIGMFKWCGVYHQLQQGFFMIRLRVPGGILTSPQLERAADLAAEFGQNELCITTRQCLQFHWIRQQDIYQVIEGMAAVGVLTRNACGDVTRNVVTCPLAGVCPHELTDTRAMLQAVADDPELLHDQRNLPRKHKVSVAGCGRACGQTLMNCQGWYPVARTTGAGDPEIGWKYHAGGGLGARPRIGRVIFDWVPADLVVPVTGAATEVFRRHGDRRKRAWARMKILVDRLGPQAFGEAVLAVLRERGVEGVERIEPAETPEADVLPSFLAGQSTILQSNGKFAVRVMIPRSELSDTDARRFAGWARDFGDGEVMFTARQNLILRNVPEDRVGDLETAIANAGFRLDAHEHLPDVVACVGTTMCNLAVSDTPGTYRRIVAELGADAAWWRRIGPLTINMNGCPNSCAQHAAHDIGLRGTRREEETGSDEGYSIYVGGSLAGTGHVGDYVGDVVAADVVPALRRLLDVYLELRRDGHERFGTFARRVGAEALRRALGVADQEDPANVRNLRLRPVFDEVFEAAGE